MILDPQAIPAAKLVGYLQGAVVPRPIALASTIDGQGNVNLSPFSFFNIFSIAPPILIFSPSRRVRDNSTKHTFENVNEVPEVVINVVNYAIVEQTSLASVEYPKGVNEFEKAGFTAISSQKIKPPRVKESPISLECKVNQIISLGKAGGAGNLIVCEIVLIHIEEQVLTEAGTIDPFKLDAVARMGGDYYCRVTGESIFTVPKPPTAVSIGIDQLPSAIRQSKILTGNDLGRLASVLAVPEVSDKGEGFKDETAVHLQAQQLIRENRIKEAWRILVHG